MSAPRRPGCCDVAAAAAPAGKSGPRAGAPKPDERHGPPYPSSPEPRRGAAVLAPPGCFSFRFRTRSRARRTLPSAAASPAGDARRFPAPPTPKPPFSGYFSTAEALERPLILRGNQKAIEPEKHNALESQALDPVLSTASSHSHSKIAPLPASGSQAIPTSC